MAEINCVCWSKTRNECVAIARHEYAKGYRCNVCVFHKTEKEYIRQMGHTYEMEMRKVAKWVQR